MSERDELFEELWSMEYRICGHQGYAKSFARDFLRRHHAEVRAETLREVESKARDFADETENSHTWWLVANWLGRLAREEK